MSSSMRLRTFNLKDSPLRDCFFGALIGFPEFRPVPVLWPES
jgi:hypothetical protein